MATNAALLYDLFQTLMKAITECPQAFIITPFTVPPTADLIKGNTVQLRLKLFA
ncbi:hypothetical protein LC612_01330 [Nostoc sp. CHAB 5834]|nr:hypothetical protein [Nostoc sp. CHAB 5834]